MKQIAEIDFRGKDQNTFVKLIFENKVLFIGKTDNSVVIIEDEQKLPWQQQTIHVVKLTNSVN